MSDNANKKHHKPWKEWSTGAKVGAIFGGGIVFLGIIVLFGFITMWLWNALMPRIFGLPVIGYWEAWGLVILAHILLGGKRGMHGITERRRRHKMRERIRTLEEENGKEAEKGTT
jgi:hypothetical protein